MTETLNELLPCPFCGGEAAVEEIEARATDGIRFSVGCSDDDGECYGYQSLTSFAQRSSAIAAWNRRATKPSHIACPECNFAGPASDWATKPRKPYDLLPRYDLLHFEKPQA